MEWLTTTHDGYPCWQDDHLDGTRVCFVGRGRQGSVREMASRLAPSRRPSWLLQVHGNHVVAARPDCAGQADALITGPDDRHDWALGVVTADCVPILWSGVGGNAAVHAGWRGLVAGVIPAALARSGVVPETAWIGPAIGACCYEVGQDVADQVVAVSEPGVMRPGAGSRPHLDLVAATHHQLHQAGLRDIRTVGVCTRCRHDVLWSYRHHGVAAGRNIALIW